jgi:hypothetical protein
VFFLLRAIPPKPPLPSTSLSFVGLSNLPPFGVMTAFSISNGSPSTLIYNPRVVEYCNSNQWITVPCEEIVHRVGELAPGGVYVFFIPAIVTNRSLKIDMECRGSADTNGLGAKVEQEDIPRASLWRWISEDRRTRRSTRTAAPLSTST